METHDSKNTNWYAVLGRIYAQEGFVIIEQKVDGGTRDITLTVDEAMDRAVAIQNIEGDPNAKELARQLMDASAQARRQVDEMKRKDPGGDYVEVQLKEETLRRMELFKHKQIEDLKRSHIRS